MCVFYQILEVSTIISSNIIQPHILSPLFLGLQWYEYWIFVIVPQVPEGLFMFFSVYVFFVQIGWILLFCPQIH